MVTIRFIWIVIDIISYERGKMRKIVFNLGYISLALILLGGCFSINKSRSTISERTMVEQENPSTQNHSSSEDENNSESKITVLGELYKLSEEEGNWSGLTTEQKLEDFDFLYKILKENYPYIELIRRKEGVDLEEQYQIYRNKIKDTTTDMQFFVMIERFIREGKGIGHMDLITPLSYDWMVSAYEQTSGVPKEELERMKKLYNAYTNESSVKTYKAIDGIFWETMDRVNKYYEEQEKNQKEPEEMQEPENSIKDSLKEKGETQNIEYGIIEEGKIAYINIKSFDISYYEEDEKLLKKLYKQYQNYENVIIDFTQNGGGGMGYFEDLIMAPNIDQMLSVDTYQFVKKGEYNQQFLDFSEFQPISQIPDLPKMNQDDLKQLDLFSAYTYKVEPSGKEKALKGKLWILVNENVYSSSEYGAMFTKASGFATLVGRTTGGDGIGTDPLPIVMKNSGLIVRYSPVYGAIYNGAGSQEFGTTPDILSPEGESELETCLKAISKEK